MAFGILILWCNHQTIYLQNFVLFPKLKLWASQVAQWYRIRLLVQEMQETWVCGSDSKSNVGDPGSIPGLGRSPREGNGNPLQYSCLENSMDGGTS